MSFFVFFQFRITWFFCNVLFCNIWKLIWLIIYLDSFSLLMFDTLLIITLFLLASFPVCLLTSRLLFLIIVYFTYVSLNPKGTSNKFAPEILSFLWYLYFTYISSKPKETNNKFALEIFLFLLLWYFIYISSKSNGTSNKFALEIF